MPLTPDDDKLLDLALNKQEDTSEEDGPKGVHLPQVLNNNSSVLEKAISKAGVSIPDDKRALIRNFMDKAQFGHQSTLIMTCKGSRCHYIDMCPLKQAGLTLPVNKPCPVEDALLDQWVGRTMQALDIDPTDPESAVDIDMIYEIAGMELLRNRAAHELSKDPRLVEEKIVGYSPHGEPIYDEKPRASLFIIEKNSKTINKIREQLLATRKAQASVGKVQGDPSSRAARLREKAKELTLKRKSKGIIDDAEYEIVEPDNE